MHVKELEIVGFKTFVDKVKLVFKPGITALVGPNGCGKSNVIDAFRWIMGEQNARNLRGKIMEDLIFNGSESRKPMSMAEVSMVLSNENGNHNPEENVREIMVTRRLYRSGESEYFINKIPCRLKDIIEFFLDAGVGLKSYSIMEQGRVDHILSLKPSERRVLIEEVAGIAKYRARKKEALSKIESTKQNLLRIRDILNEIQNQLTILEKQVKRLNRYRKIKHEIKEIELFIASHKLYELKESEANIRAELTTLRDEEIRITAEKHSAEAAAVEHRGLFADTQRKCAELQEELYQIKNNITSYESRLTYNQKEVATITERLEKYTVKQAELNSELAECRAELHAREEEVASLNAEIERYQHEYTRSMLAKSSLTDQLAEVRQRIEKEKAELIAIVTARSQVKNAMQLNLNMQREITQRLNRLSTEQTASQTRMNELSDQIDAIELRMQEIVASRAAKESAITDHQHQIAGLSAALADTDAALHELKEKTGAVRSRLASLQELQKNLEGFDEGVRSIMRRCEPGAVDLSGIVGLFADVIETTPEYETAVESALGWRLQSVIVRDYRNGLESIAYLKQSDGGRVSFIPLCPTLPGSVTTETQPQSQQLPSLASVIKTAPEYQSAVNALVGNVFIVDTIEQAITIRATSPAPASFVTPDGEMIDHAGVMTGGSKSTAGSGILQRNREIKQLTDELQQLETLLQSITNERETTAQALGRLQDSVDSLMRAKHELDIALFQQQTMITKYTDEATQCREKLALIQDEYAAYAGDLDAYQQELKELIIKEGSFKYSDDELQAALRDLQLSERSLQEELNNAETTAVEVRVKLELAQQRYESAANNMHIMLENRAAAEHKMASLLKEAEELQQQKDALVYDLSLTQETLHQALAKHDEIERSLNTEKERTRELEKIIADAEAAVRRLQEIKDEIEPRLHARELDLKEVLLRGEHLVEEIAARYHCAIPPLAERPSEPAQSSLTENYEKLEKLRVRLANIGEVNLAAATEYDETKQRFDFLTAQEQDLAQSLESLQKVIAKINRTTREKFQDAFDHVNAHFQEIFPILFQGGKAYLALTDETDLLETGIEIYIQLPGKKMQSLDLLSGGERSLTVVALIFAIFLTKPSPFCLLDEIDAALDDSNIDRFNQHLKKMSTCSQFIMVTHSKQSMQAADTLYGVTMQEQGVSKIVSVELH